MFINKFTRWIDFIANNLTRAFKIIFSSNNKELEELLSLEPKNWQSLSCPTTLSDGSIYIFSYEIKLIKGAIFHIKNFKNQQLANSMTNVAIPILKSKIKDLNSELIVTSIPSSKQSRMNRGYNPSELLAKSLAEQLNACFIPNLLVKTRQTQAQKELSRSKRLSNMLNSMKLKDKYEHRINASTIIIVDDVVTTGATLKEAKRALEGQSKQVICLALSH